MKLTMITAAALAAIMTTTASAADLGFFGGAEYTVEAEVIETTLGMSAGFNDFVVAPAFVMNNDGQSFNLSTVDVTMMYNIDRNTTAYVNVEADDSFDYTETTLGVAFNF